MVYDLIITVNYYLRGGSACGGGVGFDGGSARRARGMVRGRERGKKGKDGRRRVTTASNPAPRAAAGRLEACRGG